MFDFKKKVNNNFLDYAYEFIGSEDVYTYEIRKEEKFIYRIFCEHYHFSILGEKTIVRLKERGYLSMEEIYQKYGVTEIPIVEQSKKEGFVKTFSKRKH